MKYSVRERRGGAQQQKQSQKLLNTTCINNSAVIVRLASAASYASIDAASYGLDRALRQPSASLTHLALEQRERYLGVFAAVAELHKVRQRVLWKQVRVVTNFTRVRRR